MEIESVEIGTHRQLCDGHLFRWLIAAGHAWLEHNMQRVNDLNVFPVPDGDTGTNMHLTMRKAYEMVSKHGDDAHVGRVAHAVAQGALMGARGNSGVILSQLLAGFAEGLKDLEKFNPQQMVNASETAVKHAYNAVVEPVEGTILTVSREGVEATRDFVQANPDAMLRDVLEKLVEASRTSLEHTPELLPVLKDAGVVDSGGMGFLYIIEGMLRFLEGKPVSDIDGVEQKTTDAQDWQHALEPEDEEGYGYDVQFLIHGQDLDVPQIRADIDAMGWSTLVVGDPTLVKVHVHVHNPAEPLNYAITTLGAEIDDVVVENMQLQYHQYVENRVAKESGIVNEVDGPAVVTVVSGEGLRQIFKNDLQAAYIIYGGQTMNPSTEDFVAAVNAVPNEQVILMPNNKNILMAAQQAAKITAVNKDVRVVATRTVPQGISAMMGYMNTLVVNDLDALVEEMREAMSSVITAEVTVATRSVTIDDVEVGEGEYIGIVNGKLSAAGGELAAIIKDVIAHARSADTELVTLYYGDSETAESAQALCSMLEDEFEDLTFEAVDGGQPLYPYLMSIE